MQLFSFLRSRERRRNPQEKRTTCSENPESNLGEILQAVRPYLEVVTLSMPRRCVELRCYVYMVCKPLLMMGERKERGEVRGWRESFYGHGCGWLGCIGLVRIGLGVDLVSFLDMWGLLLMVVLTEVLRSIFYIYSVSLQRRSLMYGRRG